MIAALADGVGDRLGPLPQLAEEGEQHDPVLDGNAEEHHEADRRRDRERHPEEDGRDHPPDERERQVEEHEQRVADRAEREVEEEDDQQERAVVSFGLTYLVGR